MRPMSAMCVVRAKSMAGDAGRWADAHIAIKILPYLLPNEVGSQCVSTSVV